MSQRPDMLYPAGSVLMHPTLKLERSRMYGFFVAGTLERLQASVDATLTAVAGAKMRFKVLSPYVMLTFTQVRHAYSDWPSDEAKGWGEETDIVTWVLVGQSNHGSTGIDAVYLYPCHIWVDDCMALINGRELYGYPKYECQCTLPQDGEPATRLTLAAKGFEPFSPETRLAMHPLLEVQAVGEVPAPTPLQSLEELIEEAIKLMAASLPGFLALDAQGWESVAQTLRSKSVEQIFLKQLPDGSGVKAVYQALVTAPAQITALGKVQLLRGEYQCVLHRFASFPLDRALGLQLGAQPALLPFCLDMDFQVPAARELYDNSVVAPQKVAIIGGGVSAMTAAFYLSDEPGWQNRREITVYQQGWRLGGKGASGRNAALGQRIEEHGLHIWFGFYDNAFKTIKRAYGLLERPPGAPLATWDEAFKPQSFITLAEQVGQRWEMWPLDTPPAPGEPGQGPEQVNLWRLTLTTFEWMRQWLHTLYADHAPASVAPHEGSWLHRLALAAGHAVERLVHDAEACMAALQAFALALSGPPPKDSTELALLVEGLQGVRQRLQRDFGHPAEGAREAGTDTGGIAAELRRLYACIDLGLTVFIGGLCDGVFVHGADVINDEDFRAWLLRHGANPRVTVDSPLVRGCYDLVFAYEDGNAERPNIEAGTMLRGMMRMAFDYRGAFMWKMQAGMGDVVFAPLYEVLRRRGVKFAFFHQVEELVPSAEGGTVEELRLRRQMELAPGVAEYQPLVDVKGLPCWPSAPNTDQLDAAQAALLQDASYDLESHWSDWAERNERALGRPLPTRTLRRGVDFDTVVFGASVASLPVLAPKLVAASEPLARCCEQVRAVATRAFQTWQVCDLRQLGWTLQGREGQQPVLTAYAEPFDTWAPMDQLLCREDWPPLDGPRNVSYFCSVLPQAEYPPASDHGFPARVKQEVKAASIGTLSTGMQPLWPAVATRDGFDWNALYDPSRSEGVQRFDAQYWRANVDPSERYVQSLVGSSRWRLPSDGSGFANLYLTGDWIRTGLNAGCVEAAVMAGMQASRAMCGHPAVIAGERDG